MSYDEQRISDQIGGGLHQMNEMEKKHYLNAFDNLNNLNDLILDKAHLILRDLNKESDLSILNIINGEKPAHFTDNEWEKHKLLGQRILNLK